MINKITCGPKPWRRLILSFTFLLFVSNMNLLFCEDCERIDGCNDARFVLSEEQKRQELIGKITAIKDSSEQVVERVLAEEQRENKELREWTLEKLRRFELDLHLEFVGLD